jgi:polar amino acid transport system substrate-binding protein
VLVSATRRPTPIGIVVPLAMLGAALLAGRYGPITTLVDDRLAAQVPANVRADGYITAATDPTYEPNEFRRGGSGTIVGVDIDLTRAVVAKLGLRLRLHSTSFDDVVPAVRDGRFELGVSATPVTDTRTAEVTMVSYLATGAQWVARTNHVRPTDPCGRTVAVVAGTVHVDHVTDRSTACTGAGKAPIIITRHDTLDEMTRAVLGGAADFLVTESHRADYLTHRHHNRLRLVGAPYDTNSYGYVVSTENHQLAEAIHAALRELVNDGTYAAILARWGIQAAAIDPPRINP